MPHTKFQSRAVKALMILLSVFIALLLAEVCLNVFYPVKYLRPRGPIPEDFWRELVHQPSQVPGLDYELKPNVENFAMGALIKTNSYGMRNREVDLKKGTGVFRIAVLGDSVTFGYGVGNEETYPNELDKLLVASDPSRRYEVLNFAVGGYSSKDEALVLRHKVLKWDPDLIIIGYVVNDPETDPIQSLHAYYHKPAWWQHSNVLRLVAKVKNNWDIKRYGGGNYVKYLHSYPPKWQSVIRSFRDIQESAKSHNIKVLLANFPENPEINRQVEKTAEDFGFKVVNVRAAWSAYRKAEIKLPDGHPNALGHQLAALTIKDALVSNQLLPK